MDLEPCLIFLKWFGLQPHCVGRQHPWVWGGLVNSFPVLMTTGGQIFGEVSVAVAHGARNTLCIASVIFQYWPQVGWGYPLNLSISLSGGKETKKDSLSNGERTGKSSALNPLPSQGSWECGVWEVHFPFEVDVPKSVGIRPRSQRGWQACMVVFSYWVEHSLESSCLWVQL